VNTTDRFITDFQILYDQGNSNPSATELLGHSLYYSTTGLANSWQPLGITGETIPQPNFFANFDADLKPQWGNTPLYLLWADDNGDGSSDTGYTIDNLVMQVAVGDLKDPPPPPTPVFGNVAPDQAQGFEGGGLTFNNGGVGTITPLTAGGNALQVIGTPLDAVTDQVDLRGVNNATHNVVVGVDLKAWELSTGTDFETEDRIAAVVEWSADGLTFQSIPIVDLHGITRDANTIPPFDPNAPDPLDQIRAAFPANSGDGPFNHYELVLPANAETARVRVILNVNSTSTTTGEFAQVDNITIRAVPVPEPASVALIGLGMIGLVGYGIRRRNAA
jgi:hypothetical protein